MYIYVYVCVCVSLQGVPLGFVSCHRNPLLGIHSRFRPLFRSPSVSAKATITGQAIFLKRAPEKNGVETKKALTSLSEKSCAFHSMSIPPPTIYEQSKSAILIHAMLNQLVYIVSSWQNHPQCRGP